MKKIFLILFSLLIALLLLCGCDDASVSSSESSLQSESSETEEIPEGSVLIEYISQQGGKILGKATQYVMPGEKSSSVTISVTPGYKFMGWSDGVKSVNRSDVAPENGASFTALFIKLHTVKFQCDYNQGTISGRVQQGIVPGETSDIVTATPKAGFKFICWDNGISTPELQITPDADTTVTAIFAPESLVFPSVFISTAGGASIVSKEEYLTCTVDIENAPEGCNLNDYSARIRGRGNTSWEVAKKSYKLKFDQKTNLFGFGAAKDWALISNHFDLSLVRNYLAYSVASQFDKLAHTSKAQFIDLYVNGEYLGVYLLCEQVEVKENRVEISTSTDVDTGYLIELDSRGSGAGAYIFGKFHAIKSPDIEDGELSSEQLKFIISYLNRAHNTALYKSYEEVEELFDTESFAQAYVVFELFKCVDVGFASFYMQKDAGGKLACGPVWDFDRSVGNVGNNEDARRHDSLWAQQSNMWFYALLTHEEFRALVAETLAEYMPKIQATLKGCYATIEAGAPSFERNFERWKILGTYVYPNPDELNNMKTWQEQVDFVKGYLEDSLEFMCQTYPPPTT